MIYWTPERITEAKRRNFGESVTLTFGQWATMLDMVDRYRAALEEIQYWSKIARDNAGDVRHINEIEDRATRALESK